MPKGPTPTTLLNITLGTRFFKWISSYRASTFYSVANDTVIFKAPALSSLSGSVMFKSLSQYGQQQFSSSTKPKGRKLPIKKISQLSPLFYICIILFFLKHAGELCVFILREKWCLSYTIWMVCENSFTFGSFYWAEWYVMIIIYDQNTFKATAEEQGLAAACHLVIKLPFKLRITSYLFVIWVYQ